jgi:hypothetical protein
MVDGRAAPIPAATTIDSLSNVPGFGFLGFVAEAISTADGATAFGDPVELSRGLERQWNSSRERFR